MEAIEAKLRAFLASWPQRLAALLIGRPGCGKTTLVRAVAEDLGFELTELDADSSDKLHAALTQRQIFGKRIVLIDYIEEWPAGLLIKEIPKALVPVIATAIEWPKPASVLKEFFEILNWQPQPGKIFQILCKKFGLENVERLKQVALLCDGDLRAALLDWTYCQRPGQRTSEGQIRSVLTKVFTTFSEQVLFESELQIDLKALIDWQAENVSHVYNPAETARALTALCLASMALNRAERHGWWSGIEYAKQIALYGVAFAKAAPKPAPRKYSRPFVLFPQLAFAFPHLSLAKTVLELPWAQYLKNV